MRCPDCGFELREDTKCTKCCTILKQNPSNQSNEDKKILQYDSFNFLRFTSKSSMDKAMNSLKGILIGIQYSETITHDKLNVLHSWFIDNRPFLVNFFFDEAINIIKTSLENNDFDNEYLNKIINCCRKVQYCNQYYDACTSDLQVLHGIIYGIMSDGKIELQELQNLKLWLRHARDLKELYPYAELTSLLSDISSIAEITNEQLDMIKVLFCDIVNMDDFPNVDKNELIELKKKYSSIGLCASAPNISFNNKTFCFTGASAKTSRKAFADTIKSLDAAYNDNVTERTDYLIIGNGGNPTWAYACYGRKVEKAISMRKSKHRILIIREDDFWKSYKYDN